jgi:hypothetical protein
MRGARLSGAALLAVAGGCIVVYDYEGYAEGVAHCDEAGNFVPAVECDGRGECKPPEPQSCFPFICRGDRCLDACDQHEDCSPSAMCGDLGQCVNCVSCMERLVEPANPMLSCPLSDVRFTNLLNCAAGPCMAICGEQTPSDACEDCVLESCPEEATQCLEDAGHGL